MTISDADWAKMSDREKDAKVAEALGWSLIKDRKFLLGNAAGKRDKNGGMAGIPVEDVPTFSSTPGGSFAIIQEMHRLHPGWRFGLLGGDLFLKCSFDSLGRARVRQNSLTAFGWKAEWYGVADPRKCTGQRHGTAHASNPHSTIALAALRAMGDKP